MLIPVLLLIAGVGVYVKQKPQKYHMIIIVFLAFLMWRAENIPDFDNYTRVYNYIGTGAYYTDTGVGWLYLCRFGHRLGLDYKGFTILAVILSGLLLRRGVRYFVKNPRIEAVVWSLFLIYPALLECVQIRFFVAEAVVIYALHFLEKPGVKNSILYGALVLAAYTIHSSALFYLVLLLVPVLKKFQKILILMVAVVSAALMVGKSQVIALASLFLNQVRIDRYFGSTDSVGALGLAAYLTTLGLFSFVSYRCTKLAKENHLTPQTVRLTELFHSCNTFMWMVIPFTFFDTNFFRIQRPMWIMFYVVISVMIKENVPFLPLYGKKRLLFQHCGMMTALFGLVFYIAAFTFNIIQCFLL